MRYFYTYDGRGNICTTGHCQDEHFEDHAVAGETLAEGEASAKTHYVHGDVLTEYTPEQRLVRARMPLGAQYWDNGAMAWVIDHEVIWSNARFWRDQLLLASDWTQIASAPLDDEQRAAWLVYRQALRDITKQADPRKIEWPTKP